MTTRMGAHIFLCYARSDAPFAHGLAAGLQARGVPMWVDQWHIDAGADWDRTIDAALRDSAAVLIVLSPDAVRSREVRGELHAALTDRKRVVPVLYRPCEVPRQLATTHYLDLTVAETVTEAALDSLARALGRSGPKTGDEGQRSGAPPVDAPAGRPAALARMSKARRAVLRDMKSEALDRLTRSLNTGAPVPIALERQPYQVVRSWDADVRPSFGRQPPRVEARIADVFDDPAVAGMLLILGAPGSGKTTVLLQLAEQLVTRAELDPDEPVPVLLSLASWRRGQTIAEWLVDELTVKHGIRRDHGARWRDDGWLAPLLDGLDELPPAQQQACVHAINDFTERCRPPSVVVCSRLAEYENLEVKLRLRDAVQLLPFDAAQIREYLDRAGSPELWATIRADPEWLEVVRSPLLLSFMSALRLRAHLQPAEHPASPDEERERLLSSYVSAFASAGSGERGYSKEQTIHWLTRLAAVLQKQGETEFLIERMQPDWLESPGEWVVYRGGVMAASAAVVLLIIVAWSAVTSAMPEGHLGEALKTMTLFQDRASNWVLALSVSLAIAAVIASRKTIVPIETLTWSWAVAWDRLRRWSRTAAGAGLRYGLAIGVVIGLVTSVGSVDLDTVPWHWRSAAMVAGTAGGLLAAVPFALIRPTAPSKIPRRSFVTRRGVEALAAGAFCAIVSGVAFLWTIGLVLGFWVSAVVGFSAVVGARERGWFLQALIIGTVSSAMGGGLAWLLAWSAVPAGPWMGMWTAGGLACGLIAGLVAVCFSRVRGKPTAPSAVMPCRWWLTRALLPGVAGGAAAGLVAATGAWVGHEAPVRGFVRFMAALHATFTHSVAAIVLYGLMAALASGLTAGLFGALGGALSGATGPDVERRAVPNQGIRESAMNVAIFAMLGTIVVGVPYGAFNVAAGALLLRIEPSGADWLRLGLGAGVGFGLMAGLLPGAACIQHGVLRLILWLRGTVPLRYARFLNFATDRRLLQRVGGRYRFIHVSLRDHLVARFRA